MNPLIVTPFFDGRPGHEKQTRGLLRALDRLTAVQVTDACRVSLRAGPNAINWARYLLGLVPKVAPQAEQAHLLVGTGSRTHIPMLLTKRRTSARVVTCMLPDPLLRDTVDLCLVPMHDRPARADNLFVTLGPPNNAVNEHRHDLRRGLVLVGGLDPKSHRWDSPTTMKQIETIITKEPDREWTVSSSPRTPADMVVLLDTFCQNRARTIFFRSEDTPAGWIEEAYAVHETVWVTADSVSMVYEALTAGCKVGVLPVRWKKKTNKFQAGIDFLHKGGRIVTYENWLSGASMTEAPPLDEAERCATEILRRWWPEKLSSR